METEVYSRQTLLRRALDVFMSNIAQYLKEDIICIKTLPHYLKTMITRRLLSSTAYSKNIELSEFLKLVIHEKLIELDLTLYNVNDETLLVIKNKCPNLQKLRLDEWNKNSCVNSTLSSEALKNVLSTCPNLIELRIQNCDAVTDQVAKVIAQYCTKLKMINLCNCKNVTDEGILMLSQLKYLYAMDISGSQISDKGLQAITHSPFMENLEDIRLDRCPKIQNFDITEFASKSPKLSTFSCEGSPIADKMNHWHSHNLKNLRQINWTIEW